MRYFPPAGLYRPECAHWLTTSPLHWLSSPHPGESCRTRKKPSRYLDDAIRKSKPHFATKGDDRIAANANSDWRELNRIDTYLDLNQARPSH